MGFGEAIKTCFSKYFVFSGRAMRSEYWWFYLFTILGSIVLSLFDGMIFGWSNAVDPLSGIFSLVVFIPTLSAAARRLHDTNRSGWWQLLPIVPLIGLGIVVGAGGASNIGITLILMAIVALALLILLIVWLATKGADGPNRFGEDPFGNIADTFD